MLPAEAVWFVGAGGTGSRRRAPLLHPRPFDVEERGGSTGGSATAGLIIGSGVKTRLAAGREESRL